MANVKPQFDLSFFESIEPQFDPCSQDDIKECVVIKRLLTSLSYYSHLINASMNESDHQMVFSEFMDTIYKHKVYDDFHHFSFMHENEIESIMDLAVKQYKLTQCDLSNCSYSDRHYRMNQRINNGFNDDSTKYIDLNEEIMDSLHFNIFHLISCGLKVNPNDGSNEDEKENQQIANSSYFDPQFSNISNQIKQTENNTNRFKRLGGTKYNLHIDNKDDLDIHNERGDDTFLNHVYSTLFSLPSNNHDLIVKLNRFIESNEYDTESLDLDLIIFKNDNISNISKEISQELVMNKMVEIFESSKMDKDSFSIGIDWQYSEIDSRGRMIDITPEYMVKPHYKDLKEEMLNYKYLDCDEINKIQIKALEYSNTNIAKSVKKYGYGDPLNIDHLKCIIMYCDYTELSRDFTMSFRKSDPFQPLSPIKKHNSYYYHWSKILKQTITEYGQDYDNGNGLLPKLVGPFFCGMSAVLNVPQFNMFIYSPLSTSIKVNVSVKFSGERGMILEMDNSRGSGKLLRGIHVQWISRYREEDERLFFGCGHGSKQVPINISSIRIIETGTNYGEIIQAITLFDNIISGNTPMRISTSIWKKATLIMNHLLNNNDKTENKFDSFIYNTFKLFMDRKNKLKIDMNALDYFKVDLSFCNLIFGGAGFQTKRYEQDNDYLIYDDTNIPRFKLFDNLGIVTIIGIQRHNKYWSFSLISLLSKMVESNIKQANISTNWMMADDFTSWISSVWNQSCSSLVKEYKKKGFAIEFDDNYNGQGNHSISITKT